MENIPFFTTENGAATLILREIPFSGRGYIWLLGAEPGRTGALLEECAAFCRMAGARSLYARGEGLEHLPVHARIWLASAEKSALPRSGARLVPLTPDTAEEYRTLLNRRMAAVPCSATLRPGNVQKLVRSGGGYFVERDGSRIGAGQIAGNELQLLTALVPGGGRAVALALAERCPGPEITVQVALENRKAASLYDSLGFRLLRETERWYRV